MTKKRMKMKPKEVPPASSEPILVGPDNPTGNELPPKKKSRFWVALCVVFMLLIGIAGTFAWQYYTTFNQSAGLSNNYLLETIRRGLQIDPFEGSQSRNILFLGVDRVGLNRSSSLLTDTMMIVNISKEGSVKLLPIPRDLWIDGLKTKVNALYYYGEQSQEVSGEQLVQTTLQDITGLNLDHIVLLDLNSVEKIVDAVGGITIEVEEEFTDSQYPRDDVSPDALPVSSRYKTISFEKGIQHINGSRALEFIRSRKSQNENENTDEARSSRQEKVINALINQMASKELFQDPKKIAKLYTLWHEEVETTISDEIMVSYIGSLIQKNIKIQTLSLPIRTGETEGILYNPPIKKYNQWVYEPVDSSWQELKDFIQESLQQ
jgi:LCP family protein required for cell wall assembly